MKVYMVTDGCYSDFRVEALYSKKELADEHVRRLDSSDAAVEEMELDQPIPDVLINVSMAVDGTVINTYRDVGDQFGFNGYSFMNRTFNWKVKTDDRERAIKVANEKRAQIIAANAWGNIEATEELFK
ncbi:MAG: hypothetical protein PHY28_04405 [Dehalococcoidales bacterium]|nr:hypothetical protein [Dehalococcoidales bacterium]